MVPSVVSIQVGLPQTLGREGATEPMDRPWRTGFFKQSVTEPVWVAKMNITGDGQADLKRHGGPEKAVLAYSAEHYPAWQAVLEKLELPFGAFGENFTIAGQTEAEVCIGDIYEVGTAQLQVSQPRQPCWKLARRWRRRDLAKLVQTTGRTGWYFRVLQQGYVEAGSQLQLCDRPYPEWTIEQANRIMHQDRHDRLAAGQLAACPLLASNWKKTLLQRANQGINPDPEPRLWGEN